MNSHDVAWAAGFLDGEAYVTLTMSNANVGVMVQVVQVVREPLDKLQKMFGGKVKLHNTYLIGYRDYYRWQVKGIDALNLIRAVHEYLVVKRKQADVVLEFAATMQETRHGRNGIPDDARRERLRLFGEMSKLNKTGRTA